MGHWLKFPITSIFWDWRCPLQSKLLLAEQRNHIDSDGEGYFFQVLSIFLWLLVLQFFQVFVHLFLCFSFPIFQDFLLLHWYFQDFTYFHSFKYHSYNNSPNYIPSISLFHWDSVLYLQLTAHLTPGYPQGLQTQLVQNWKHLLLQICSCVSYLSHCSHQQHSHPIHKTDCHPRLFSLTSKKD